MKKLLSVQGKLMLLLGRFVNELSHFSRMPRIAHQGNGTLSYACNICGKTNAVDLTALDRETRTCLGCGSTLRQRAIIAALSRKLFGGKSLRMDQWMKRPDLAIRGISDAPLIDRALSQVLHYQNTYFHQTPFLDITRPAPADHDSCDVLICSDVLEHVPPPVSSAFSGLRKILRPGGFLLLTVPCSAADQTTEHYPTLHDYRILKRNGGHTLVNRRQDGTVEEFGNLIFHGGPGETLEMRLFSLRELESNLRLAGFDRIEIFAQPDFAHGVYWKSPYAVPVVAS